MLRENSRPFQSGQLLYRNNWHSCHSPPGDLPEPITDPVEGEKLHFARLRVFQQVPLVVRQFNRELCWKLICAVPDASVCNTQDGPA